MTNHEHADGLKRGELARRTGCNPETIRYYEKISLLMEPLRDTNSYRVYDESHVGRLRFILRARELGFTIAQVRALLGLVDGAEQTCAEVKALTEEHLRDVRARIADLRRIERTLATTAAQCTEGNPPSCPILEALAL